MQSVVLSFAVLLYCCGCKISCLHHISRSVDVKAGTELYATVFADNCLKIGC